MSPEPEVGLPRELADAELLDRTWKALAAAQPMYHAVLLFRVENPDVPSPQMAEQLGAQLGTRCGPIRFARRLQRSHAKFAELLVDEVAISLGDPIPRGAGRGAARAWIC